MAGNDPKVTYEVGVDNQASGELENVAESAGKAAESTSQTSVSMAGLQSAALASAAALGATGAAMIGFIQASADARNELTDMATRTGIAAETLAGLKLAADGSGLSLGQFESALSQLPRRMAETAEGTGKSKEAFEALGVSVVGVGGELRSADDVLKDTVRSLGKVESPTKRAALATDLFGRAGGRMLQALGDGSQLDLYIKQAEKFGVDVGPKAAKAAQDWQRETAALKGILAGMGDAIGGAFGLDGGAAAALETFNFALVYTKTLATEVLLGLWEGFRDVAIVTQALLEGNMDLALEVNARVEPLENMLSRANEQAFKAAAEFQKFSDQTINVGGAPKDAITSFGGSVTSTTGAVSNLGKTAAAVVPTVETLLDELAAGETWDAVTSKVGDLNEALAELQSELGLGLSELDELRLLEIEVDLALQRGTMSATEYAEALELIRLTREGLEAQGVVEAEVSLKLDSEALGDLAGAMGSLVGGDFTGAAGGALAAVGAAGPVAGGVLAGVDMLATLGEEGADSIVGSLEQFMDFVVAGLGELDELITGVIGALIDALPEVVTGIVEALPDILVALIRAMGDLAMFLIVKLPFVLMKAIIDGVNNWWDASKPDWWGAPLKDIPGLIWEGITSWWSGVWEDLKALFSGDWVSGGDTGVYGGGVNAARVGLAVATGGLSELGHAIGLYQSGGYVGRTQLAMLHQGERVVAKGGAVTGAARRNMGMTGSGWSGSGSSGVTVNLSSTIMDRDAIPALVRQLERVFGEYGRGTSPLFIGG